jgi:hypothetical protein
MVSNAVPRIVRVKKKGTFLGMGVCISEDSVLSCAHVLRGSRSRALRRFTIDFPLAEVAISRDAYTSAAWFDRRVDLALLRIDRVRGVEPASLNQPIPRAGTLCFMFGCPTRRQGGVWVEARVMGPQADGLIQADCLQSAYDVAMGFSGGGVWQADSGTLLGVVARADSERRAAYFIPVSRIAPFVEQCTKETTIMAHANVRGTTQWALNAFRVDVLSNFLDDLTALEHDGLDPNECDAVKGTLGRVVNAATALPDEGMWKSSIAAHLQTFEDLYKKWNEKTGREPEAVAHRTAALRGMRKCRQKLARRISKHQAVLATEIDHILINTLHREFRSLFQTHPVRFNRLGYAVRRYRKRSNQEDQPRAR